MKPTKQTLSATGVSLQPPLVVDLLFGFLMRELSNLNYFFDYRLLIGVWKNSRWTRNRAQKKSFSIAWVCMAMWNYVFLFLDLNDYYPFTNV